jgi:ATP-dependent RNA helicase DbpA
VNTTELDSLAENTSTLSFSSLSLRPELLDNLASLDYNSMTPIQAKSLPSMLNGSDIIAQAKTGSGKTATFGLTLLNSLNTSKFTVQALVLCPTRELAEQVSQVLRRLARLLSNVKVLNLSGGLPMRPQVDSLKYGSHIIVGTPGRVQKHLDQGSLSLNKLQTLVLDEADRMLDMGFEEAIKRVISFCPKDRQTFLFSATYPTQINQLASNIMHNPIRVTVDEKQNNLDIEQKFYELKQQADKFSLLRDLLYHHKPISTLIFCNTKEKTNQLSSSLKAEGFSCIPLNGDMDQKERDLAMIRFSNRSCSILVATDVAARGLDIKELPVVINYDLAFESDIHVHRIGRTGRSGNKGIALSLTTPADAERLCVIENNSDKDIPWGDVRELSSTKSVVNKPLMVSLCISAGRKDKVRPGDILGALTKDAGLDADNIGKIDISALYSYVAIKQDQTNKIYPFIKNGKLKGRKVSIKLIR